MTQCLLDSDIVVDLLAHRPEAASMVFGLSQAMNELCTCSIVLAEVYSGLRTEVTVAAQRFLSRLTFLPTSAESGRQAGQWRYAFARRGRPLHTPDVLIAATALEHDAVLVTGNLRHFPMAGITLLPSRRTR